jgi:hypothetical protein
MVIKTIHSVLGVLMTLIVWCAVVLLAIVTFHWLVISGFAIYHLLHS